MLNVGQTNVVRSANGDGYCNTPPNASMYGGNHEVYLWGGIEVGFSEPSWPVER